MRRRSDEGVRAGIRRAAMACGVAFAWLAAAVTAQDAFPSKPISLVVPFPPGGVADIVARPVADAMSRVLNTAVVIDWSKYCTRLLSVDPEARRCVVEPGIGLDQLNRQLTVLEGARAELEAGWVQGGWWTVSARDGSPRLVTGNPDAGSPGHLDGVCLVGAVVRAGPPSDIGRSVASARCRQAGGCSTGLPQDGQIVVPSRNPNPHFVQ